MHIDNNFTDCYSRVQSSFGDSHSVTFFLFIQYKSQEVLKAEGVVLNQAVQE